MSTEEHAARSPRAERSRAPRRPTRAVVGVLAGLAAGVALFAALTPWPSAMIIRSVFRRGGEATAAETGRHVPHVDLDVRTNIPYGEAGADTTMDVFRPLTDDPLPTIVWIHGGAWISGAKEDVAPYLRILAAAGYTTIGVDYTRGPEGAYPLAVHQLDRALSYIDRHADELGVDASRLVLAGDSAGSQLASQLAALITNPLYAETMGVTPSLHAGQLAATILNCGVYDLSALADLDGLVGWGFKTAMWAYSGTRDWAEDSIRATMSTIDAVTSDFPPTLLSGGNGDGLTALQSVPMAARLRELGVDVTTLFWPDDHEPALPHEYQFHLDLPDAQTALATTLDFLRAHTR